MQAPEAVLGLFQQGKLRSSVFRVWSKYEEGEHGFDGFDWHVPSALQTPHPGGIGTI